MSRFATKHDWLPFDITLRLAERDEFASYCNETALAHKASAKYGASRSNAQGLHLQSVTAQMGASQALNRKWVASSHQYTLGVGLCQIDGCVVRGTTYLTGGLMLPGNDADPQLVNADKPWVLVILAETDGLGWVAGWRIGKTARKSQWLRTDIRVPAYIVPQGQLYLPSELVVKDHATC